MDQLTGYLIAAGLLVLCATLVWLNTRTPDATTVAPPPQVPAFVLERLIDTLTEQSKDRVAEVERVLAAFVEQSRDSNQHLSGIMTAEMTRVPNQPYDVPPPVDVEPDMDIIDPTDWGDLSPLARHDDLAMVRAGDPNPFGIDGLAPAHGVG